MTNTYSLGFPSLVGGTRALWSSMLEPDIRKQLQNLGRNAADKLRYGISVYIFEGQMRPAKDLDNYYKPIIDTITQTQLLWFDDEQIDDLTVLRLKDTGRETTSVTFMICPLNDSHIS